MSRDGFATADLDTGLLHDPKVVKLARRIRNEQQTATHVLLYVALVLESWRSGERVTLDEALPAWWTEPPEKIRVALQETDLIDEESRIPEDAWSNWYGPANQRRENRRFEGTVSGLVSHGMPREEAIREANRRRSGVTSGSPQGVLDPSVRPSGPPTGPERPSHSASDAGDLVVAPLPPCPLCEKAFSREDEKAFYQSPESGTVTVHRSCKEAAA